MLDMESDINSDISVLWEKSIAQILKESALKPVKIEADFFAECENIECIISVARASGAQGLFRGRLRAEGEDSVSVRLRIDWLAGNTSPQTDIQIVAPLAWDAVLKSGVLLRMLSGITGKHAELERTKNKVSFISVETNPDFAVVMLNGNPACQSPCVLSDSGSMAQIAAYWHSNENLWAAKRMVKLGEDTVKVFLELKRSYAGTEIRTNPEKALVFPAGILDINSRPIGKTPYNVQGVPGETQLRLFRKGYNDTLLNVKIDALEKQIKFVQLSPITDPQKIYEQDLLVKSQRKRNIGLGLLGGSVAPLASGILLCVLAQDDYKKARNIREELSHPSFGGSNFKSKIDDNHKAVEDGNFKTTVGAGLIGFSFLLAGVGLSISF
jgi:hypothetical protein